MKISHRIMVLFKFIDYISPSYLPILATFLDSDIEEAHNSKYGSHGSNNNGSSMSSKSKRYFWQYNVQAKGPKGQRLVIKSQIEDPHFLNEVTDPVFSPHCSVRGIKVC